MGVRAPLVLENPATEMGGAVPGRIQLEGVDQGKLPDRFQRDDIQEQKKVVG
jgi:hypothetical protein